MNKQPAAGYQLTPATAEDGQWLDALRRAAYRGLFEATWGGWDEARHQRHLAASLQQGGIEIISVGGRRVGMLQLVLHADAIEVGEIQILPGEQGNGIGTAVLLDIIQQAHGRGAQVRLSTGLKNVRARQLYERLGFRLTATTDTHFHLSF